MDFNFKSAGRDSVDILSEAIEVDIPASLIPIGIVTPLRHSPHRDGFFAMHYDLADQVSDNLRNLIQTNHGERLGNPKFGANLKPLSLEILGQKKFEDEAMRRIQTSVGKYLPYVNLKGMSVSRLPVGHDTIDNPTVVVRVEYTVKNFKEKKIIDVIITLAG